MPCSALDFRNALLKKYGSLSKAWEELDTNRDACLQFHEFTAGCRKIQFRGNLRKVFEELSSDGGQSLRMADLDASMKAEEEQWLSAAKDRLQQKLEDVVL